MSTLYLFSYDICNDKTRRHLVKLLNSYGYRQQKSVFLCQLNHAQALMLQKSALKIINAETDQILLTQCQSLQAFPTHHNPCLETSKIEIL
jgi:CRISPR-associated endonuclease Cas2